MGCCEEEGNTGSVLDFLITVELGTVIRSDGFDVVTECVNDWDNALIQGIFGSVFELADDEVAGCALDQGEDAVLGAVAHDGIDLPVADGASGLDDRWSFGDVAFAGQAAAAVISAIALAALFGGTAKVAMQIAADSLVGPDMAIDGFMADQQDTVKAQVAGDLFRVPALAQVTMNDGKVTGVELGVTPSARAAIPGTAVRLAWPVMTIGGTGIAPKFTRDGAW